MELIRKYNDEEQIKLGVVVPTSDSYKEFLDSEKWDDVEIPEGHSVFLFPKDTWDDWKKMSDLLIEKGIMTDPPYIIGNPDITYEEFFNSPSSIFYHHNREISKKGQGIYNSPLIDVDLTKCPKIVEGKELTVKGSKVECPECLDQFLGYLYDPEEKIKAFIEENRLVLKSGSTSDGTIMGFKLVWVEVEKTYEELLEEYEHTRIKFHINPSYARKEFDPETKFLYALVIPKQKNEHLSEFFIQNLETWGMDNFNPETQALIEIPLSYIESMNVPDFIVEKGIKN